MFYQHLIEISLNPTQNKSITYSSQELREIKNKVKDLEVSWYSLEQYIGCIVRQAFNYYCSLHQSGGWSET